jgi:hypothetical protein
LIEFNTTIWRAPSSILLLIELPFQAILYGAGMAKLLQ